MRSYLNKPYDLLEIHRFKLLFSFGGALFCFLFLYIFEPFGLYNLSGFDKLKIISLHIFSALIISVVHLFLLQRFFIKSYNLKNTLLWISWMILLASVSSFMINDLVFNEGRFYYISFIAFIGIIIGTTIIPIAAIILWHYIYTLKKQIKVSGQLNSRIRDRGEALAESEVIVFESSNKRDNVSLPLSHFLYITSADNYIDVYYKAENDVKHNLLRNTLSNIEKTFANHKRIQRCHQSYIVNTSVIESVLGNASGYKLKIKATDELIPVSRKYRDALFRTINS